MLTDQALREEWLDRIGELAEHARPSDGLESLDSSTWLANAAAGARTMAEGSYQAGSQPGLEAIVQRFTRPVYLVQQSTFRPPADSFPNSEQIRDRLEAARAALELAIPSTGRIDLRNHQLDWVGTGWLVAPGIVVTNAHVAQVFATEKNGGFAFRQNHAAPPVKASVDWRHEYRQREEAVFKIEEIVWIEPDNSFDVALLHIANQGADSEVQPSVIELMTSDELASVDVGSWISVIGYPAHDSRNNAADQQRIFDGIYNVKRLAPGQVTARERDELLYHDATTLGGNSGSVVLDLASGKAMALHFGGIEGERNAAVQAPRVQELLQRYVS